MKNPGDNNSKQTVVVLLVEVLKRLTIISGASTVKRNNDWGIKHSITNEGSKKIKLNTDNFLETIKLGNSQG